jgi:hypothetical protein
MRRTLASLVAVLALALVVAAPVFAGTPETTGSGGAGSDYGLHHAGMAQEMGGFTGTMNPGVHHQGFSNWDPTMPMP